MNNILKWLLTGIGVVLFIVGLIMKISEKPASYDQFIAGNSYIILVVGIEAILLNFAFSYVLKGDSEGK